MLQSFVKKVKLWDQKGLVRNLSCMKLIIFFFLSFLIEIWDQSCTFMKYWNGWFEILKNKEFSNMVRFVLMLHVV